jgi:phage baseplate assembly protein gpV
MASRQFLHQSEESFFDTTPTTDEVTVGKLVLSGIGGVALDIQSARMTNLLVPQGAKDVASRYYVDARMGVGFHVHSPVAACATTDVSVSAAPAQIDGVTLSAEARVLLVGQGNFTQNGVYLYQGAGQPLLRADDGVDPWMKAGAYFFVNAGDLNGHSAWVLFTDDPITIGTTELVFDKFSGLGQVVAGGGLTQFGEQLDVGKGDGIAVGAESISIDLDLDPALTLVGTSPNKKLAFLPDATRGLYKDADGAFIQKDDVAFRFTSAGELDFRIDAAGGLTVGVDGIALVVDSNFGFDIAGALQLLGLPANFELGGVPVSNYVTAASLDALTNGGVILSEHIHAAQQSVPNVLDSNWTFDQTAVKGKGVYISAVDTLSAGSCGNDPGARIIGVMNSANEVCYMGIIQGMLTGAVLNTRYFLGVDGSPVLVGDLPGGARVIQLGIARNETDLAVEVFDFGRRLAGTPGGPGGGGSSAPVVTSINGVVL